MKRWLCVVLLLLLFFAVEASDLVAFENDLTHRGITDKAVERSVLVGDRLEKFLRNQDYAVRPAAQKTLVPLAPTKYNTA
jgi:hypothetical protein